MATVSSENPIRQDSNHGDNERCLTIAERLALASQERCFLDGPTELSDRETRKKIARSAALTRHEVRQD